MEDILEFFVYLFTDSVIGIEQTKKDSKGFRIFVFTLLVIVMCILFGLGFIYKNNTAIIWAILICVLLIILFFRSLWRKVIELKRIKGQ